MATIFTTWQGVKARMGAAQRQARHGNGAVHLLAVSKTFPAASVRALYVLGQRAFGENYVQELVSKALELADLDEVEWHFIGPLQSNKTRQVAEIASWVHTVDRLKIAERLSVQRPESTPPLNVCIQVNVSGEASKSGVTPAGAAELVRAVARLPRLRVRGLMCIPEPTGDDERLAAQFATLRGLKEQLECEGIALDTLSMGMSSDLEIAIREGATMVRVGTALFGARN